MITQEMVASLVAEAGSDVEASADELGARIIGAALEQFSDVGIRRSSMDDVARRAGVSRITVFRRFATKEGLVAAVLSSELRRGMSSLDELWQTAPDLEGRLVRGFGLLTSFIGGHPLFDRLLRSEPDLLLPLLTVDGEAVVALYRELILARLRQEPALGEEARAALDQLAELIARLAVSTVLTPGGFIDRRDPATLEKLVRDIVLPLLLR